jgi:Putative amidoligase enzyme
MTIALASVQVGTHWIQCADCDGWFNPSYDEPVIVPDDCDEKVVCTNCADKLGFAACAGCRESFDTDGMIDLNGYWHCENCATNAGMTFCSKCDEWVDDDEMVDCNGTDYCEDCAKREGWARCGGCDEWVASCEQHTSPEGNPYCNNCFCEVFSYCESCSEIFYSDDMVYHDNGIYCHDCASDRDDFTPSGFRNRSGRTTNIGSERCFGLELETEDCDSHFNLNGHRAWGAKNDPTVKGKEFYSDILDGDEGLEAVVDITEFAEHHGWQVDGNCGYHLHIDMRHENDDSLKAAAFAYRATADVWHSLVSEERRNTGYSHRAQWNCADLTDYSDSFQQFVRDKTTDRYEWLNLRAYSCHYTFEVRLHHGSLDEKEICNWVKAHTRFTDWATTLGFKAIRDKLHGKPRDEQFSIIADEAWNDKALRDYYAAKVVA